MNELTQTHIVGLYDLTKLSRPELYFLVDSLRDVKKALETELEQEKGCSTRLLMELQLYRGYELKLDNLGNLTVE